MAKHKIPYKKIMAGMKECFKPSFEKECSNCPYDKYNDHSDANMFGDAPNFCCEYLERDAKRLFDELEYFCHCEDCEMWSKCDDQNNYHHDWETERRCTLWNEMTGGQEFCSRGCRKDD